MTERTLSTSRFCVVALALMLFPAATWVLADDAKKIFDTQYAERLRQAKASPARGDDLDLAQSLLTDVSTQPPAVGVLLCRQAHLLAKDHPEGTDVAIEAMEALAEIEPTQTETCLEAIFVLQQARYDSAQGRKRNDTGREVIRTLLDLAKSKARRGQGDVAEMFLRQAMTIAHDTRSNQRREIEARLKALPEQNTRGRRLQELIKTLGAHPNDTPTRAKLILLYLVDLNDARAAGELLTPDLDETLRSHVPLLDHDPNTLPVDVTEEMAAWLGMLTDSAPNDPPVGLLLRRRRFLNRVLQGLPVHDPRRKQAANTLRKLDTTLATRGAIPGGRRWSLNPVALELVATPQVHHAIRRAQGYLVSRQQPDGAWLPDRPNPFGFDRPAMTALATYALLQSGMGVRDARIRRALRVLRSEKTSNTLALSLRCCVWALCRNKLGRRYERLLRDDATRLYRSSGNGGFGALANPAQPTRRGDAFHTQWAILGLAMAAAEGTDIPRWAWSRNASWWRRGQNKDGGWGRRMGRLSRHFYTAAGAVSLLIDQEELGQDRAGALEIRTIQKALAWVDENFDTPKPHDQTFYLFVLARLGAARGSAKIDTKNWYTWAARELLPRQQRDGAWRPQRNSPLVSTSLNLLTLSYARGG